MRKAVLESIEYREGQLTLKARMTSQEAALWHHECLSAQVKGGMKHPTVLMRCQPAKAEKKSPARKKAKKAAKR